ncbi:hypothetical protein [Flavobacterium sp.]|jgi:hypothetical protein|uniref:hypothetical protein n=1 Tax=Flavobacterium sp. TaxID=239 RepID=UPI002A80988D|nr:hypothetical protein [Flavobacterium sp.]
MKKIFSLLFVCTVIASCREIASVPVGNTFYFDNPQPINDSELKSFPSKFLGIYMNSDSTFLDFQKEVILENFIWKSKIPLTDLDSLKLEFDFSDNEMISKDRSLKFSFRRLKDSIEIYEKRIDTIFSFSSFQKVKRINGNLVISEKDSAYWNIKLLSFDKDKLTVKQLYSDSDLKKMDSIMKVKSKMIDSTTYVISPSRSEFKKVFKLKNFGYDSRYKKID